jgi:hypothetical protein
MGKRRFQPNREMGMSGSFEGLESDIIEQARIRSAKRTTISPSTEIYKDLGLYGMDPFEIIRDLHEKYGTDFHDLDLNHYVPAEIPLLRLWKAMGFYADHKFGSLTVGHLAEVVRRGEWFPPANSEQL